MSFCPNNDFADTLAVSLLINNSNYDNGVQDKARKLKDKIDKIVKKVFVEEQSEARDFEFLADQ